jgi:hypothetical protein
LSVQDGYSFDADACRRFNSLALKVYALKMAVQYVASESYCIVPKKNHRLGTQAVAQDRHLNDRVALCGYT